LTEFQNAVLLVASCLEAGFILPTLSVKSAIVIKIERGKARLSKFKKSLKDRRALPVKFVIKFS
jgi:hypothetical protein